MHCRKVIQYDKRNKKPLREFRSIKEAQKAFNCTHVSLCCRNKRYSDGGYIWKYAEVQEGDPGTKEYRYHKNNCVKRR